MQRELYEVEKDRFDLKDSSLYHLQGIWPKNHKPEAVLDGEKLPAAISAQERVSALERFKDLDLVNGERVQMEICLPDLEGKKKLVVYAVKGEKRIRWFSVSAGTVPDMESALTGNRENRSTLSRASRWKLGKKSAVSVGGQPLTAP